MIPTGGYSLVPPTYEEPVGFFGKMFDQVDRFQRTDAGMALQGLPPEGFIIGGVKTGLNLLGKVERVATELGTVERVATNAGGKTVTLYRVDDAAFAPRIAADGSIPVVTTNAGNERALFVNIGQPLSRLLKY